REDPELVAGLRDVLVGEGVVFHEGVAVERVARDGAEIAIMLGDGSQITASHVLLATGRAPRLAALDLVAGRVDSSKRGITTDAGLRSVSNRRVFACGDIADPAGIGPRAFTHVASQHAGVLARRMIFRLPAKVDYTALPRVTYTDPEIAQIGLTEAEARAAGHAELAIMRWPLVENDRAVAEGIDSGLIKLVATKKGVLLGASILAPGAGEMAGTYGLMIGRKLRLSALAGVVLPYPTLAEMGKRAAGEFYTPKLLSPLVKRVVSWLKHF
ncbi:MAG: Pyruvate/2-oxoglutarate dehydrogenase complex, dihydrolipoamide dehydrogenase component, partial [Rhodospirillales bacterium]|nr:Pyruvate/2-oxoglutarate dehydrogenase complex, dihydrolipoamide dehydrogenase component [Rhodospirillales bacterium]